MPATLVLLPILTAISGGVLLYFLRPQLRRVREISVLAIVLTTSILTWLLILFAPEETYTLMHFSGPITLGFRFDRLGRLFAGLISVLWPITTVYAFEYMKDFQRQNLFFAFFTIAYGVTLGVSMAGNMLTLYFFYELLTLVTLPLVMHDMTKEAIRAARTYLYYSIGGAAFAFIGMVFLIVYGGSDAFVPGGMLSASGQGQEPRMLIVYVLAFMGFGVKAAVFPVHAWLPKAAVAPTPVTALLHAVAVVKAGAFGAIRLTYSCYGADYLRGTWAQHAVLCVTAFTIVYGGVMAVKQGHWKRRLAYSTVANLSYVLFGVALMSLDGLAAALMHLLFHANIKILAFFCAGAVLHQTGREYVCELDGLGKRMPLTFVCFLVAALSLTGIPPLNGFISKWHLILAAVEQGTAWSMAGGAALILSALMTAIYMLTAATRSFFPNRDGTDFKALEGIREANGYMTVPMVLLALGVVLSGIFAKPVVEYAARVAASIF